MIADGTNPHLAAALLRYVEAARESMDAGLAVEPAIAAAGRATAELMADLERARLRIAELEAAAARPGKPRGGPRRK